MLNISCSHALMNTAIPNGSVTNFAPPPKIKQIGVFTKWAFSSGDTSQMLKSYGNKNCFIK